MDLLRLQTQWFKCAQCVGETDGTTIQQKKRNRLYFHPNGMYLLVVCSYVPDARNRKTS